MMDEIGERRREAGKTGWYLLIAALLIGAPLPFNGAVATLSGGARDGLVYALRWSSFFYLYWAPLGIWMYRSRMRMGLRVLVGYIVSVPLYAICLWLTYPTAQSSFHPFQSGFWPIYLSMTPVFFGMVVALYAICRKRGWLLAVAATLAIVLAFGGVVGLVVMWARTDVYRWPARNSGRLAIVDVHIVDLSGGPQAARVVDGKAVLIENGKISSIEDASEVGTDWTRLDAAGLYLLPGLIDVHAHLIAPMDSVLEPFDYGYFLDCVFSHYAVHRRDYLESGVTAVRDDGGPAVQLFKMRGRIAAHEWGGPRLFSVGRLVTAPHGHPVATIWKPFPALIREGAILADNHESLIRGLELNYREGPPDAAKFIYGTIGEAPERLSPDLLKEGIAWATARHLISVVHAETTEEVREAIADAATGVEHVASVEAVPQDLLDLIHEKRPYLDPTFGEFNTAETLRKVDEKKREADMQVKYGFVRQMRDAGGVMVIGTDAPLVKYGTGYQDELKQFEAAGFSRPEILTYATVNNAAYLGAAQSLGRVEAGFNADLILVKDNPLQNLDTLRKPEFVIRDGIVVVRPGRK
jgi:imidazolonepropionase-like amidohydrolase